jgi:ectoine hydroxylase-related dioxygenase (phytanoyl-CoA dioxygenase family)
MTEPAAPTSADATAALVREQGWAILRAALSVAEVAALVNAVDRALVDCAIPFGTNEFLGFRTRRVFNLLARSEAFESLVLHPALLPVAERLLGSDLLLSSLTAIEMNPGETPQPLHADDGTLPLARPHPPYTCTAIVALSEFTSENGATHFVPGSHAFARRPRPGEGAETRQAAMPAGGALVYHGSLWHGGGANRSAARRLAIVVNYCAGFLRQEECQLLALPRERVARMAPRLQGLVGYSTYKGLLGHVDQRNPAELVDPSAATDMVWRRMRSGPG